ncbi:Amino acid/polyamine transporter I [Neofusicoccum parvum]|uniref:Amino acid/polyamine transporter I n=1 Tax=Neofusicoccum parvum TaxID=310453 RepID=A0ACB5S896_9PEZI|nr:Amino acid/polyamine transporter I [Neofusicoccum parvum]
MVFEELSAGPEPASELKYSDDAHDMARFGKKSQLKRIFGLVSIIGLTCCLVVTWEAMLVVFQGGLLNGGNAGLIYGYIFVWVGTILQVLVMAEMASMIPLAGGQYNWVAVLAPPSCSKFLSYLTGWACVIGWQCMIASGGYLAGTQIQGLLVLNYPDYEFHRWHGTLLYFAVIGVAFFVNTVTKPLLPVIELAFLGVHVVGFVALLVPLIAMAPHASAKEVFATFYNGGGWESDGLSFFIGLTVTMFAFVGCDAAAHMSEEIQHASSTIPRSMFASVFINGVLGLATVIATCFCLGSDPSAILATETGYPVIEMFRTATGSNASASGMTAVLIFICFAATVNVLTSGSRMLWAFARERGLPFSAWLSRVHSGRGRLGLGTTVPLNAIVVFCTVAVLLSLINVGSAAAFNAFTSLVVAANYLVFLLSASVLLLKRLRVPHAAIPFGPFRLGRRLGPPVIAAAIAYTAVGLFFSFWPPVARPGPETMNWCVVVFGGAMLLSLAYWAAWGRKVYTGPVVEVEEAGGVRRGVVVGGGMGKDGEGWGEGGGEVSGGGEDWAVLPPT